MEFVRQFLTPIIKVCFYVGIFGFIFYIVGKAFHNAWSKQWKFVWKYKIRKKPYPEKTMLWCMEAMEKGIGWYDVKKLLMVAGNPNMNETLWIYDQVILEFNNQKGGINNNGRKHGTSFGKVEKRKTDLPNF